MAPIVGTVEVGRSPSEVFAYVTDPSRFAEWQWGVVSARLAEGGPAAVGSRIIATTRIGGTEQVSTLEITELSPPRRWVVRGVDGPVRVTVDVTVEPLEGGAGSRVTLAVDFEGRGAGKMLVPLVVRPQAAKEAPKTARRLADRLGQGG